MSRGLRLYHMISLWGSQNGWKLMRSFSVIHLLCSLHSLYRGFEGNQRRIKTESAWVCRACWLESKLLLSDGKRKSQTFQKSLSANYVCHKCKAIDKLHIRIWIGCNNFRKRNWLEVSLWDKSLDIISVAIILFLTSSWVHINTKCWANTAEWGEYICKRRIRCY